MRRRLGPASVVPIIVLALSAAGGGTAYAARDSLPGDALYPVKLGAEQMIMLLPGNDVAKVKHALDCAERRAGEIEALVGQGRFQHLARALQQYDCALTMASARMHQACNRGLGAENPTAQVAQATARHLLMLDEVWDKVPDQAKAAIAHAQEVSERARQNALAALARNNPISAVEINLATMAGRLNRITVSATVNDMEAVEIGLRQFEGMARFGQQILQIIDETGLKMAEVAELVAQTTSVQLEMLEKLYEDSSAQMGTAFQGAIEQSFRVYEMMIDIFIASDIEESQLPVLPEKTRQRMEEILGWADVPKAGIPTGGSSGQSCPSCRR